MSALLYLVGPKFNHLTRASSVTVATGAEDPLYPLVNIDDDRPAVPFRFNALVANSAVKCDLAPFTDGVLTTWAGGVPSGFTKTTTGTGTVTQLSPGRDGTGSAARLNGGAAGTAILSRTFTPRAGELWVIEQAFQVAATGTIRVQVYNYNTNKFLQPGGTWAAAAADFFTQGATAWGTFTTPAFQIEPFGGSNPNQPLIQINHYTTNNVNCDVDDIVPMPGVNFSSFHGHNLDSVGVTLNSSTDNFVANNVQQGAFVIARPSFYVSIAMTYKRWWAFTLNGTNQAKPYIGEWVVGQAQTAARGAIDGFEVKPYYPQFRNQGSGGEVWINPQTTDEQHIIRLPFEHTIAEWNEIRNEWLRRSQGGFYPMVIVPLNDEPSVYYGRLDNSMANRRVFPGFSEDDVVFTESPFWTQVG